MKFFSHFSSKKAQFIAALGVFLGLFLLGYHHAGKGFNITDEGLYISSTMRYSLGDAPFHDAYIWTFDLLFSPIFFLFRNLTLFQFRTIGIAIQIFTLFVIFLYIKKFAPPLLCALFVSVIFFFNIFFGIPSPSYNLAGIDFSTISLIWLLFSFDAQTKWRRISFAVLGGFFFVLAVVGYLPTILLLSIPILFLLYNFFFLKKREYFIPLLLFVGSALLGIILLIVLMQWTGILPDFVNGLIEQSSRRDIGQFGIIPKAIDIGLSMMRFTYLGLILAGVFFGGLLLTLRQQKLPVWLFVFFALITLVYFPIPSPYFLVPEPYFVFTVRCLSIFFAIIFLLYHYKKFAFTPFVVLGVWAIFSFFFKIEQFEQTYNIVSFIVGANLLVLISSLLKKYHAPAWQPGYMLAVVWFFSLGFIYSLVSAGGTGAFGQSIMPLVTFLLVTVYLIINDKSQAANRRKIAYVFLTGFVAILILFGLIHYYPLIYNEKLPLITTAFSYPQLKGISSTSDKVETLEELLYYLKLRVKPGDFFLAYYNLPLLYYLTQTRPADGQIWNEEPSPTAPKSVVKEKLLNRMISEHRIPAYVVRAVNYPGTYLNYNNYNYMKCMDDARVYIQNCIFDQYVQDHYYIEKVVYPFEIWRRGPGPQLKVFNAKRPVFQQNVNDISKLTSTFPSNGNFTYAILNESGEKYLEFSPTETSQLFTIGYRVGKNNLNFDLKKEDTIILTFQARLTNYGQSSYVPTQAAFYIVDENQDIIHQKNLESIYNDPIWREYIISKKIKTDGKRVSIRFEWIPDAINQKFDIKDIRVYVEK